MTFLKSFLLLLSIVVIAFSSKAVIDTDEIDNHSCAGMNPICFDELLTFPATKTYKYAEWGAYYGCLWS